MARRPIDSQKSRETARAQAQVSKKNPHGGTAGMPLGRLRTYVITARSQGTDRMYKWSPVARSEEEAIEQWREDFNPTDELVSIQPGPWRGAVGNPALNKDEIEQRFIDLVTDRDPNAMLIAEDLVIENDVSLADLGEQWMDAVGDEYDLRTDHNRRCQPSTGIFVLSPDGPASGSVYWRVHQFGFGNPKYEIEITVRKLGLTHDDYSFGHVTYFNDPNIARREAAADAWVIAKAWKRDIAEHKTVFPQHLIDAMFLPDNTPDAVFGGKRAMKMWGSRESSDKPSDEAMKKIREHLHGTVARTKAALEKAKKNPGELPAIQKQYEDLVRDGMARVLWAYAYGAWAQQDIMERDPDAMNEEEFSVMHMGSDAELAGHLRGLPVQVGSWVDHAPETPHASFTASRDLMAAITRSEEVGSVVDLFAMVVEIETGEPFEYVDPTPPKRGQLVLLLDSARGQNIPRDFADAFAPDVTFEGITDADLAVLRRGPDGDEGEEDAEAEEFDDPQGAYWDTWYDVLNNVIVIDRNQIRYHVDQTENGDMFLVPEGMVPGDEVGSDEYWAWPEPEMPLAEQFGQALAHMALCDGLSWFDDHPQKSANMEWDPQIPHCTVGFDGDEMTWKIGEVSKTEHTERRIRISFEQRTLGKEDDDPMEVTNGWEDEEGVVIKGSIDDDDDSVVDATVKFLRRYGGLEPSSPPPGTWYTEYEPQQGRDYFERGIERYLSFHLDGYTEEEERAIYEELEA